MAWSYERTKNGYAKLWSSIKIKSTDLANATRFANKIIAGKSKYLAVQAKTGVPWYVVGALHMRESSCDFKGVLHNGEKIIGTRRKTKLVPAGRGPFSTWQAAAIDALNLKNLAGIEWCPARIAYESERYNGLGYTKKGVNSPYVWAGSNHEQTGKYIRDHVWDKNFDDPQIGTMTVLKALSEIDCDIADELAANHKPPMSNTTKTTIGGAVVAGGGVVATANDAIPDASGTLDLLYPIIGIFQNYGSTIATVFTAAIVVGAVAWHFWPRNASVTS